VRRALVAGALALVAVLVLGATRYGPLHRYFVQRKVGAEASLAFPGAERTKRQWQDEEHARYIDSGGYDERAGWTTAYKLREPVLVSDLFDFYERALTAGGWRVVLRQEPSSRRGSSGGLQLVRGTAQRHHRIDVVVMGLAQADATAGQRHVTNYGLAYLLPYERSPKYDQ
jgi:hypothetical protein